MLFTTLAFACGFLPVVYAGFFVLGRFSPSIAASWLFLASLFFYGYWMPQFTALLLGSIAVNYLAGRAIALDCAAARRPRARLLFGISDGMRLLFNIRLTYIIDALRESAVRLARWQP